MDTIITEPLPAPASPLVMYRVLQNVWSTLKTDIIGKIHCIKHTNIAKCLYILGDFHSGTPGAYN